MIMAGLTRSITTVVGALGTNLLVIGVLLLS